MSALDAENVPLPATPPPVLPRQHDRRGRPLYPWSDGTLRRQDPTYGRVDHDIQWDVWAMLSENGTRPVPDLSQLVAIESTLQTRRDREGGRTPHLSRDEYSKVRAFGLNMRPRFIDDGDGIRFGFVILAIMCGAVVVLGVVIGIIAGVWTRS